MDEHQEPATKMSHPEVGELTGKFCEGSPPLVTHEPETSPKRDPSHGTSRQKRAQNEPKTSPDRASCLKSPSEKRAQNEPKRARIEPKSTNFARLGSIWARFGLSLGSIWAQFGLVLGSTAAP